MEAVTAEVDRFRCQCGPYHPGGAEGRCYVAEGDCGCTECPRCGNGTRGPMACEISQQHP